MKQLKRIHFCCASVILKTQTMSATHAADLRIDLSVN
jgi:hypothetical protein